MRSVWGMTTRQTVIGVKGPEHAITYDEAVTLHTVNAARLCGDQDLRGTLTPGRLADLTVWDQDPARCPSDALRDLNPVHTIVGGRLVTR
jgi:predicted amidohydrolase YtcJ